jgi:hypothetical protein
MTKNNKNSTARRGGNQQNTTRMNRSGTVSSTVLYRNVGVGGSKAISRGNNKRVFTNTPNGIRVRFQDTVQYLTAPVGGITKTRVAVGGIFSTFAWLNPVAMSFSKYRVHNLRIAFASTCPTTTNGDVTIAWVADTQDAISWLAGGSQEQIFSMGKYATGPTWAGSMVNTPDACLSVNVTAAEIHNAMPWFYVGSGSGASDNTRYAGSVIAQVSYNSTTAITNAGRLFVEYDIEFCQPVSSAYNSFLSLEARKAISDSERETVTDPTACSPGSVCAPLPPSSSIPRSEKSFDLQSMDI